MPTNQSNIAILDYSVRMLDSCFQLQGNLILSELRVGVQILAHSIPTNAGSPRSLLSFLGPRTPLRLTATLSRSLMIWRSSDHLREVISLPIIMELTYNALNRELTRIVPVGIRGCLLEQRMLEAACPPPPHTHTHTHSSSLIHGKMKS
jgi:hypothetical protein